MRPRIGDSIQPLAGLRGTQSLSRIRLIMSSARLNGISLADLARPAVALQGQLGDFFENNGSRINDSQARQLKIANLMEADGRRALEAIHGDAVLSYLGVGS
jgi:hypothetical protein